MSSDSVKSPDAPSQGGGWDFAGSSFFAAAADGLEAGDGCAVLGVGVVLAGGVFLLASGVGILLSLLRDEAVNRWKGVAGFAGDVPPDCVSDSKASFLGGTGDPVGIGILDRDPSGGDFTSTDKDACIQTCR